MAKKIAASVLTPEWLEIPFGDLVNEVEKEDPREDTDPDVAEALGAARHYLPEIWRRLRDDVRDTDKVLTARVRTTFLDTVSLSTLFAQPVFKDHVPAHDDYLFLRDLVSVATKRARLRQPPASSSSNSSRWTDPALEWMTMGSEGRGSRR